MLFAQFWVDVCSCHKGRRKRKTFPELSLVGPDIYDRCQSQGFQWKQHGPCRVVNSKEEFDKETSAHWRKSMDYCQYPRNWLLSCQLRSTKLGSLRDTAEGRPQDHWSNQSSASHRWRLCFGRYQDSALHSAVWSHSLFTKWAALRSLDQRTPFAFLHWSHVFIHYESRSL